MGNINFDLDRKGSATSTGALSKAVLFIYAAILPISTIAAPTDLALTPRTTPVHHIFKRSLIARDEGWCLGKVHQSEGAFRPTIAVCQWDSDPNYKVFCHRLGSPETTDGYWINGNCDVGFDCKQLEDVKLYNGKLSYDIDCVPTRTLVKWALGAREQGMSLVRYCTKHTFSYSSSRGTNPLWEFYASFFGTTGQQTQIHTAEILLNGKVIASSTDHNNVAARHHARATDHIQYCGTRGSDSLIEGFATARVISYVNAEGLEEIAEENHEFTLTTHEIEEETVV
ncbi:hypothetical protein J1614_010752 [Plenodomus biglobosus]|nr:hypothetical protein J1614_010752 [Plenodomus biglobosus]